jgi:type II secretory pathway component PulC
MVEIKPKDAAAEKQPAKPPLGAFASVFGSFGQIQAVVTGGFQRVLGGRRKPSDIKILNICLLICSVFLFLYFVENIMSSLKKMNSMEFTVPQLVYRASSGSVSSLREAAFYIDKVKQRDIFKMVSKARVDAISDVISSKAAEVAQNFRLVGISWSSDPDAMIEDVKMQRTLFVKKGQKVGEAKVESIMKDRVLLRYGEELIELR